VAEALLRFSVAGTRRRVDDRRPISLDHRHLLILHHYDYVEDDQLYLESRGLSAALEGGQCLVHIWRAAGWHCGSAVWAVRVHGSGDSAITYSAAGGGVPGLSLAPDGRLSGTPTQPGAFPLTVSARGASGGYAEKATTITINRSVTSPTLTFTSGAPPNGTQGQAYASFSFTASGDSAIMYAVTGGGVPGLLLSPEGQLSGTPTQSGTFTLTVTAQGASGSHADQPNTIMISPPGHSNPPASTGSNPPTGIGSNPPTGGGSNPPTGSGTNPPTGSGSNPPTGGGSNPPTGSGTTPPAAIGSTTPGVVR
jgi:hypothetical protein